MCCFDVVDDAVGVNPACACLFVQAHSLLYCNTAKSKPPRPCVFFAVLPGRRRQAHDSVSSKNKPILATRIWLDVHDMGSALVAARPGRPITGCQHQQGASCQQQGTAPCYVVVRRNFSDSCAAAGHALGLTLSVGGCSGWREGNAAAAAAANMFHAVFADFITQQVGDSICQAVKTAAPTCTSLKPCRCFGLQPLHDTS